MKEKARMKRPLRFARHFGRAWLALWLLMSVAAMLAILPTNSGTAFAINPTPIPEPTDPPEPPPAYFTWSMAARFGLDANGDGVTDYNYDPAFVSPATFRVTVTACPYVPRRDVTYTWKIDGALTTISTCSFTRDLTPGTHRVRMSASVPGWPTAVDEEDLLVRDILIASLGDSFASGEGNPDVPQQFDWSVYPFPVRSGPRWADWRCHRSAYAGPAQAALAIEQADPHTSVTFVSLACSGAELIHLSSESYAGREPGPYLWPQLYVLRNIVGTRRIDALVVSGGGNDLGFGTIIENCIRESACNTLGWITNTLASNLAALPGRYLDVTNGIAMLNVADVYFTQYPNLVRNGNGDVCDSILGDVPFHSIDKAEAAWAEAQVILPLNTKMREAVDVAASQHTTIGWHYVDGIAAAFAGSNFGHGYCAGDQSWVRQASDSSVLQGPTTDWINSVTNPIFYLQTTTGTMHPTARGHLVYRDRILAYMFPHLFPAGSGGGSGSIDFLPYVSSILPVSASITSASSVDFLVTFSEPVTGVDVSDFYLTASGVSGASITGIVGVTGAGSMYYVRVNTGSGNGAIRLDLIDNDTIMDGTSHRLGDIGLGNGSYTSGQSHIIDKTSPVVSAITRASSSPALASSVDFTVTFSENVSGVDANGSDFSLTTSGVTGASITGVAGSGSVYTVTVNTGSGNGTIRLDVPSGATIKDLANNNLNGLPFTGGESYSIIKSPFDDTDPNWTFGGTWYTYTGAGPYGNGLHYSSAAGAYAEFTFVGRQFVYIYTADNNRGTISVSVDGVNVGTINNYAASTQWQQQWTSPIFTSGIHTVRFIRNAGAYFDTDGIKILP